MVEIRIVSPVVLAAALLGLELLPGPEARGAGTCAGLSSDSCRSSPGCAWAAREKPISGCPENFRNPDGSWPEDCGPIMEKTEACEAAGGIEWVPIPAGRFVMGSETGERSGRPAHPVDIAAFELSKTEVTVEQYKACVEAGMCEEPFESYRFCNWGVYGREKHPINCVSWGEAGKYAEWAGARLPSEAEWEYAARGGGRDQAYPWGSEQPDCGRVVMSGCGGWTRPVCSKPDGNARLKDGRELCDMAGNVEEWAQDAWHESYLGAPGDGAAWQGANPGRVLRGGSYLGGPLDSTVRGALPSGRYPFLGLRLAR